MSQGEAERTCLWEDGLRECVLGIVGTGPGFAALAALAEEHDLEEFLPPMRLAGVACTPEQAAARGLDRRGTAHYDSWRELLAAHPDLTVLVDLREERLGLTDLRTALPPQVSLIDRQAAVFLCALHNMHRAGAHTRTRLGHSRALLDAVVTQIREDILLLDLQGRVLDMNPHVYQRTGRPKEELLGQPCRQVQTLARGVPFCPEPCADCPVQATLRTERKAEARMTRVSPGGELLYFRVYSYPIFDERGDLERIMVMRRDITTRTRLERERQQAEKLSVVGEMSMYLAHEIRNPLCAIGGFITALGRSPNLDAADREKVEIILAETRRLDAMLTSVLNFARPAAPGHSDADIAPLMREAAELMGIGYAGQGFRFACEVEPGLPRAAMDPDRLKQCLVNLMKNAMEAMPGGGEIALHARREDDMLALEVRDRGHGMSPRELDQVFSPFRSTKAGGYGLGLAMIRKLMDEAGGDVRIASTLGQGTSVTLLVPAVLSMSWSPSPVPEILDDTLPRDEAEAAPGCAPKD
jgi:PAS domain S-box-containing protein